MEQTREHDLSFSPPFLHGYNLNSLSSVWIRAGATARLALIVEIAFQPTDLVVISLTEAIDIIATLVTELQPSFLFIANEARFTGTI